MCGIAGIHSQSGMAPDTMADAVGVMTRTLKHRGTDDMGFHFSEDRKTGLGHTRLSIIDLSSAGHQPMSNESKSIWIVYNGEIYNFPELRDALLSCGHRFNSETDTETVLHGYEEWGIEDLLKRLRGMFAFAVYDTRPAAAGGRIILARDRLGLKPLYYSYRDGVLVLASEIKAILASHLETREIDPHAVGSYLLRGFIPPPATIYKDITALRPGHYITVDGNGVSETRYYDLAEAFCDTSLASVSEGEAVEMIHSCLVDTMKCHLISDVPVGAFLSGGIDSSSIVAVMREVDHRRVKTVSAVFPDTAQDESRFSRAAAEMFNTDHAEIEISGRDVAGHMEKILYAMDQPTVDGVNTYFVSWATALSGLKVAMSGVGGDEIFWGYPSFRQIPRLHMLLKILATIPFGRRAAKSLLRDSGNSRNRKLHAMVSNDRSIPEIYMDYRGLFARDQIRELLCGDLGEDALKDTGTPHYLSDCASTIGQSNLVGLLETTSYMASQLLRDTDVFSMTHTLEVRAPFVDHTLVELLARLPARHKTRNDVPKRLLVKALDRELPAEIVDRPKQGFVFPFDLWMRNELKDLTEDALNGCRALNGQYVSKLLSGFYDHKVHWSRVWSLVVLANWLN
ncbi:MAG: asparagine synthase (glutamine-hydrolyzing) [Candidatus Eisenbacteria bacterium]